MKSSSRGRALVYKREPAATQYSIAENAFNNCKPPAVTAENGGGYKKRWTAPALVDRVLKYFPELENEIETLELKKQNYLIQSEESTSINSPDQNSQQTGIDSTTISKRWTAPALVDRVLKYFPELENEKETLELKKQNYLIQSEESTSINSPDQSSQQTGIDSTTVSVNEVREGEAIIQICMENSNAFTFG
ncbi:unnamed protein product [Fraxinus pennsylvanica]|uniref:Uncharacterized protein n=1 Tax=Fraxinus pennsylvanica TaxID=56036 RepID=A0AAD2DT74_9LAMI|nr:unnamed protein product [Fraxinus pennsylvanica]